MSILMHPYSCSRAGESIFISDGLPAFVQVKIPAFNDKDDTPFPGEDILQYIK